MNDRTDLISQCAMEKKRIRIILGVIGSDCHAVGNIILERKLTEAGFDVINLGVMITHEEFVEAAIEHNADAVMVSSLYGHAKLDCDGLAEKFREKGLDRVVLYVGGNLGVGSEDFSDVQKTFLAMGFDRAFPADCDLKNVFATLLEDIGRKQACRTAE